EQEQCHTEDEQQQFLEAEPPAGLLDAGQQELHGRPGHVAIAAAVEEVQRDRDGGGQASPEHVRRQKRHKRPQPICIRQARYSLSMVPKGRDVSARTWSMRLAWQPARNSRRKASTARR